MPTTRLPLANDTLPSILAKLIVDGRRLAGWSQAQLAQRARTSKAAIWRLETKHARVLDLVVVESVLKALGCTATLEVDGRHFMDRTRQLDAVHAWLNGFVARRLRRSGWQVVPEVILGDDAPRGWIDLLAYRQADGTLLVEETKTDIPDAGQLQRSLAFYQRMAWRAAEALGWQPTRVIVLCVVLDSAQVHERIAGARDLFAASFPADVAATLRWLEDATAPAPYGWCIAAADPASRERLWLRRTPLARRRRTPAYQGYADAALVQLARARDHVPAPGSSPGRGGRERA